VIDVATTAPAVAPPAAVLWDMDGTLVDTEPYWMACEHELVAAYGGQWSDDDARSIIGFDLLDAAAVIRDRGGVPLEPREIVERLLDGVIDRVRGEVPWRPGARQLLTELNRLGVPCALVTMSWSRLADAIVEALAPIQFQAVITGDNVSHGKPHPEPYLRAAAELGVDPVQCVALEDSPTGVAAAGAAGCVVVAVPHLVEIDAAPGRYVVNSLRDVTPEGLGALVVATPPPPEPPPAVGGGGDEGRRRLAFIAAAVVAVAAIVVVALRPGGGDDDAVPPRQPGALNVHTWTPYWALEDALPELEARADTLHELSPFWYRATGVESIEVEANTPPDEAEQFLDTARERSVPLVASILDGTEPGVMAGILADPAQRARHVDAVASFAAEGDFDGVDIDYEQFAFTDGRDSWADTRPNWVAFITELADRLHGDGRTLSVSIPPVYDAGQTDDSGYWVYDYAAIAPLVDSIRVMAYDYSTASSAPGPIAPIDWVDRIIAGTSAAAGDPAKLVLGIPLYGYNWPVATTGDCPADTPDVTTVSSRTVDALAAERGATPMFDPATYEWSFQYQLVTDDGTTSCTHLRQVNYVDADGVQARIQRAVDAGFGGVALFAFGYDDAAVWGAVDTVAAQLAPPPATTAPSGG
jgi:HAD superfamily hydrolase (TIGR01509 family)